MKDSLRDQVAVRTQELQDRLNEREIALREVVVSSQSKSVFLANLSHELRTPLNHIIGYVQILKEDAEESTLDHLLQDIDRVEQAAHHLLEWIEEIIDLSRIEASRAELEISEVELESWLGAWLEKFRGDGLALEADLKVNLEPGMGSGKLDLERTRRILHTLLKNACKSSGRETVLFHVRREAVEGTDWLSFSVRDSGPGIDPRLLENLFKDYTQADPNVSSAFGAVALHLALCQRLSRLMGGNIFAESELGRGTTLSLRLPADVPSHLAKPHVIRATNRLMDDIVNR